MESGKDFVSVVRMDNINEQIVAKEDYAVSLDLDINYTEEQIRNEIDETNLIFLTDHLKVLLYELDRANADIYLLRKELKILENEKIYQVS